MSRSGQEFWKIVESQFEYGASDYATERREQARQLETAEIDEQNERLNRIGAASHDRSISEYFLDGIGTEGFLIASLQTKYRLKDEQEAVEAINTAMAHLHEVTDYGDEA